MFTATRTAESATCGVFANATRPIHQQPTNIKLVNPTFVQTGGAHYRLASATVVTTDRVYARPVESSRRAQRAAARSFDHPYRVPKPEPAKGTRAYERMLERRLRHAEQERDDAQDTFILSVIGVTLGMLLAL